MSKGKASDGALKTFSGKRNRRRLVEAVKSQTLISGNVELAHEAINSGTVRDYQSGELLMEQGSPENDIFLIVSGAVSVRVNRREVIGRAPCA